MSITTELLLKRKDEMEQVINGLERLLRTRKAYLDAINKELEMRDGDCKEVGG